MNYYCCFFRRCLVYFSDTNSFRTKEPPSDILEKHVDEKYYVQPKIRMARLSRLKDPNYPKPYIS